jgi:acyl-CoA thioester hydrolase
LKHFIWPIRVYYEDTDAGGVVYYANYLKFLERARTEWLRAAGFEQTALLNEHQILFVVREVKIEYLKPALFNDNLQVTIGSALARASAIEIRQRVTRSEELLAEAQVTIVTVNTRSFKPVRIPPVILEKLVVEQA